jgi:hypothetical protein
VTLTPPGTVDDADAESPTAAANGVGRNGFPNGVSKPPSMSLSGIVDTEDHGIPSLLANEDVGTEPAAAREWEGNVDSDVESLFMSSVT